jgi:hypothetical protein
MRQASALWAEDERFEFIDFIARNPEAFVKSGGVARAAASEAGAYHLLLP